MCNRKEDGCGRDPDAADPEVVRPCSMCGTACYVKRDFVLEECRVLDWFCFRRAGGRDVAIHPEMQEEIERAGLAAEMWEAVGEIRKWLAEYDSKPAHAAPVIGQWWWRVTRRREEATE